MTSVGHWACISSNVLLFCEDMLTQTELENSYIMVLCVCL